MNQVDLFDVYTPDESLKAYEYDAGESGLGLFETYGRDLKTVLKVADKTPRRVWTLVDGDDGDTVWLNGYWVVNRILYAITNEEGNPDETYTICADLSDEESEDE